MTPRINVTAHRLALLVGGRCPPNLRPMQMGRADRNAAYDYPMTRVQLPTAAPVYYATSLSAGGLQVALDVAAKLPLALAQMQALWPGVIVPACPCLISPLSVGSTGDGGAYHYGCSGTDLYCDACITDAGLTTLSLYLAELSEVYQDAQGKGWDCGASNGEALSRVQSNYLCPAEVDGYQTFPSWLDSERPNWIDRTEPTDQDSISTGCAVGFIWWLASLGYSLPDIASAGGLLWRTTTPSWAAILWPGHTS